MTVFNIIELATQSLDLVAQSLDRAPARRRPSAPRRVADQYQAPSRRHASRSIIDELFGIVTAMLK